MNSGIRNEYQFLIKHFLWLNTLFLILITSNIDYKKVLSAFLFGMLFSEVVSYLIFFDLINWQKLKSLHLLIKGASPFDPSPFMHHSFYSIFLAVSILIIFDKLKYFKGFLKLISVFFLVSATINLFINGGRLGQIALIFGVLVYALIKYKNYKAFIGAFFILTIIFFLAYNFSVNFKDRINYSLRDLKIVFNHKDFHNSWGQRIGADIVFLKIILNSPKKFILGCGAGDAKEIFFKEGKKVAPLEIKYLKNYLHLHNQYFQLWCDGGIVTFLLVIVYFFYLYKYSPLPITAAFISILAFSFIGDVILYRPKTYLFFIFMSFILLSTYRETSNTGRGS
ncbi:MAG: O-antigen ligase family protein [Nautiliaceae bacterium]